MQPKELKDLVSQIQLLNSETQTVEVKSAHEGCPRRLYDTLSGFSNQDEGGIILFGLDENENFKVKGVYDINDLQKQVNNQCKDMEPPIRPLLTVADIDGVCIVSAEIPAMDITERPCYYKGKGKTKGSYIRCGDSDEPMTEYEVYSYEAYRKKYQDDIRVIERANLNTIDTAKLENYINSCKKDKPNLSRLDDSQIYELMSITSDSKLTLTTVLLFSLYPQAYFPQLSIVATVIPGTEQGAVGEDNERFTDNKRIEGSISEMLDEALQFVKKNMRTKTIIDPMTGKRTDKTDYPITAVREVVLNALVHRDYSIHTEGMPIQLIMYEDRIEVINPGGLYGRLSIDQLGKTQPDTRNPVLATAMETLSLTENRYSGIPTIRNEMQKYGLPLPVFENNRGEFKVILYKNKKICESDNKDLLEFCIVPRTREEIADFLGISSVSYAITKYVKPLINIKIGLTNTEKPNSHNQKYFTIR